MLIHRNHSFCRIDMRLNARFIFRRDCSLPYFEDVSILIMVNFLKTFWFRMIQHNHHRKKCFRYWQNPTNFGARPHKIPNCKKITPFENLETVLCNCLSPAHLRLLIHLLLLMKGNVHPNPCPVFPCSVSAGNVTWMGRSMQCCTCSKWVHLKSSLLSFSRFRTLGRSHSWSCPPCCVPAFSGDPTPANAPNSSSDSSGLFTPTAQSGLCAPPLPMQHSSPTLSFKPHILFPPTSYLLSLRPHHRLMLLAVSLHLLLPLLPPP